MATWTTTTAMRRKDASSTSINLEAFRAHMLNLIVLDRLPFNLAKSPSFRAYTNLLNTNANLLLPRSTRTIRKDLAAAVRMRKSTVIAAFRAARSKIHLIPDGWIFLNNWAFLGVGCQFVDSNGVLRAVLLGLCRTFSAHTGDNLAEMVLEL